MFWDPETECLSREAMAALQNERLRQQVKRAVAKSPFYRRRFAKEGLTAKSVHGVAALARLPLTTKNDLREHFPFGFCAVPRERVVRVHASSGTTGRPTPVFYTAGDLKNWTECMARNCTTAGVGPDDVCQMAFKYTLFTGAFGHHAGVERIGAAVIPASSGQTERHILLMQDFQTTVLHCTPSYAITIAEKMDAMGVAPQDLSLRLGIHGAEPMSEELRREIEARLGTTAIGDYGLTELGGPGVSIECPHQDGYHINEDHFYPEIINPQTLERLPEGEVGELVLTTLMKEAVPLLRYRTRDITRLDSGPCRCGRTLIRHAPIMGRSDDMLIVGGVNFFPSQIESLVLGLDEVAPHYLIRVGRQGRKDTVRVDLETTTAFWAERTPERVDALSRRIEARARDLLGFRLGVDIVPPGAIARSEGKAVRVKDER